MDFKVKVKEKNPVIPHDITEVTVRANSFITSQEEAESHVAETFKTLEVIPGAATEAKVD